MAPEDISQEFFTESGFQKKKMDENAEKTEIHFRKIYRDGRFVTVRSNQNH